MKSNTLGRFVLPYCIQFLDEKRFVVLNRNYKPVGLVQSKWVDYDAFAFALKWKLTRPKLEKIDGRRGLDASHVESDFAAYAEGKEANIYLFSDANPPWDSARDYSEYIKRLHALCSLELDEKATHALREKLVALLPSTHSPF